MRNPTDGLRQMAEQLDHLSEMFGQDFWNQIRSTAQPPVRAPGPERTAAPPQVAEPREAAGPPADLYLTPTEVCLCVSLPGLAGTDQVQVSLAAPATLVIEAWLPPPGGAHAVTLRRERYCGYCTRTVTLPVPVVPAGGVKARYEHGLLELRLQRAEPGNSQGGVALLHVDPPR